MRINHSVLVQDQAIAADGIQNFDLAVNPLSVVLIRIAPLAATSVPDAFALYESLNRVSILFRGEQIFAMRGEDAAVLAFQRHGINFPRNDIAGADNDRMSVILPLLLGRFAYDPRSCFPASRRGELNLELDVDVASTGYDGYRLSVEAIELLGAKPVEYERKITQSQTFGSTGDNDVDLPVGNKVRGVLLFGTTSGFGEAVPIPSWGRLQVLLDNQQHSIAASDFEVAHGLSSLSGRQSMIEATGATNALIVSPQIANYAFLDFDPTRDDTFSIDTKGHSRLTVRANAETADAVRAISVERVAL